MAKTTTTLEEIIRTQAKTNNFDDMFSKERNQIIIGGDIDSLFQQVARYTPFIKNLTDKYVFGYYKLLSDGADKTFKQMFLNRFLNREIAFQTLDLFRNRVVGLLAINDQYLSATYDYFFKYAQGYGNSVTTQNSESVNVQKVKSKDRNAQATLPQDTAKLNLEDDNVAYPDTANYDNASNQTDGNSKNESNSESNTLHFDPSVLEKLNNVYNIKLKEFDYELFLKVW